MNFQTVTEFLLLAFPSLQTGYEKTNCEWLRHVCNTKAVQEAELKKSAVAF